MRNFKTTYAAVAFAAALVLAACATPLSDRAAKVRIVHSTEEVKGYTFLGQVVGSSAMTGVMRHQGMENAVNEVLDKAAAMGATHVLMPDKKASYWTFSENVRGEAYKAPDAP